jgi:hypothetical protein
MKVTLKKFIEVEDWDELVRKTYGKPYCFQQQDGCQSRGIVEIKIPDKTQDNEMNESIPEVINGETMGVKFKTWLDKDPKENNSNWDDWEIDLFWERNFYPDLQTVANDLHSKGLIEAGNYTINIDW